jgi:hypothetical protein
MSLKKALLGLLVAVLILIPATSCQKTTLTAIELVPEGANFVARIHIDKILNDQNIRELYDEAEKESGQPQTFDEALEEMVKETGIDPADFAQAVVFLDITTMEQNQYIGAIVEGTFEEEPFIDNIEEQMGEKLNSRAYKDNTLYIDADEEFAIAFLSEEMLLVGTEKAVKDIIDVNNDDRKSITGPVLDTYEQLGDALIKLALELPEEAQEALTEEAGLGGMPISFEPFKDIDVTGFALDKVQETLSIRIETHFLSAESAQDAGDTISGAINLFKGLLTDPEVKGLLEKIEVTVNETWLTIAFSIELSEIEEMIEKLQ